LVAKLSKRPGGEGGSASRSAVDEDGSLGGEPLQAVWGGRVGEELDQAAGHVHGPWDLPARIELVLLAHVEDDGVDVERGRGEVADIEVHDGIGGGDGQGFEGVDDRFRSHGVIEPRPTPGLLEDCVETV
jgi:hypothetical protein